MVIKLLETPEETTTKMLPCLTGLDCCLSEDDKRNCHSYAAPIMTTVEPRFNEPLFNEVLDITERYSMSRPNLQ